MARSVFAVITAEKANFMILNNRRKVNRLKLVPSFIGLSNE